MAVMGVPATIDNDLANTDYTIGFDTATNVATQCIDKIRDTADSHDRLFFVEVMGRDTGFIALRAAIASGAICAMLPENNISPCFMQGAALTLAYFLTHILECSFFCKSGIKDMSFLSCFPGGESSLPRLQRLRMRC